MDINALSEALDKPLSQPRTPKSLILHLRGANIIHKIIETAGYKSFAEFG